MPWQWQSRKVEVFLWWRPVGLQLLFCANLKKVDLIDFHIKDTFLRKALEFWCEVNYHDCTSSNKSPLKTVIWCNCDIRIDNKPFFFKNWYQKGIIYVEHLAKLRLCFHSFKEFKQEYSLEDNFVIYYSVISSIKTLKFLKTKYIPLLNKQKKTGLRWRELLPKKPRTMV